MTQIEFSKQFLKEYRKLIKRNPFLRKRIDHRVDLFQHNPKHNSLHSHKIKKDEAFSFSVTGDIRVLYIWKGEVAVLTDIGTHKDVYK